ncbi:putative DD41D transposase [Trichonephila clavipes]|nr:putative DD41D transposase [Trichonephila clavipes]
MRCYISTIPQNKIEAQNIISASNLSLKHHFHVQSEDSSKKHESCRWPLNNENNQVQAHNKDKYANELGSVEKKLGDVSNSSYQQGSCKKTFTSDCENFKCSSNQQSNLIKNDVVCNGKKKYREVFVGITFQDGDRFNSCQVIYSQFGLAIHQNDHQARRRFVEWTQNEIAVFPDFHKQILFSDEAHFWLNGYVNKQNCRIWSEANPQVYVETPLHPEKLTVWCALWASGIIGPYFFKNDEGHNVTVNGDRYRAMITNFFIPELNNHDVQELWFQQDGATCHTDRATIDLLKDTFGDRLISRFGPVNWPPRSCNLTPLDYFLWGYVKSLVYADKPQTLDHLEDNIRRVIADIRPQMLEKVIEIWTFGMDYIRASRGIPTEDVVCREFTESTSLDHLVAIPPGMTTEWSGFVSSQAKLERYTPKKVVRQLESRGHLVGMTRLPAWRFGQLSPSQEFQHDLCPTVRPQSSHMRLADNNDLTIVVGVVLT